MQARYFLQCKEIIYKATNADFKMTTWAKQPAFLYLALICKYKAFFSLFARLQNFLPVIIETKSHQMKQNLQALFPWNQKIQKQLWPKNLITLNTFL